MGMEVDKIYLQLNEPVQFYNVCTIYQPTIKDILIYKEENFNRLFLPFLILQDYKEQHDNKSINPFDLLFLNENISIKDLMINSLLYFCREKVYEDKNNLQFRIGLNAGTLNRNNYDEFVDTLFTVFDKEKNPNNKQEEPPQMSEKQKKIWLKLQEGRRRTAERNALNLSSIINVVMFGGNYYISSNEIKDMTVWQLLNAYKSILNKDSFYINFEQCLAGVDSKGLDLTHWSQKLRIK
jgi:hypothetical protein